MGKKGIRDVNKREERLGEERLNSQGDLMRIVKYNNSSDMIVEFQDEYKAKVHAAYGDFKKGIVKNPYHKEAYGFGMIGIKYSSKVNGKLTKEYNTWLSLLQRCYDEKYKNKHPTYKNVTCCDEWLLYENFYEWLHSQENFDKWLNGKRWAVDKDILVKGNKVYSPETCCLVPHIVNGLFAKSDAKRGNLPIGVSKFRNGFQAQCKDPFAYNKRKHLGVYLTIEAAFYAYKQYKENVVRQVAHIEFDDGNITKQCYESMMNYEVEITD